MVLDPFQIGYFIEQVGYAAASFGVAKADIEAVAYAINDLFDNRCGPKTAVIPAQGPQFQSICTDKTCPLANNSSCAAQPAMQQPLVANKTLAMGEGRMPSGSGNMSASSTPSSSASASASASATANAAIQSAPGLTGVLAALVAFFAL